MAERIGAASGAGPGPRRLHLTDLDHFILGAAVLGSGGGGDAELYRHQLSESLPANGIELIPLAAAVAGGVRTVAAVGMIGATSMMLEKLPSGGEIAESIGAAERWTGVRVDAVMPVECAGVNATLPVAAAADLGLPLIDADLTGRALPRFDQLSVVATRPELLRSATVAQPGGQLLVIDRCTPFELERTIRSYVAHSGGWAGATFGPLAAADLGGVCCEGTLGRAVDLGRRFAAAGADGFDAALAELGGVLLAAGRVIDVVRAAGAQFSRTSFAIADRGGPVLRVEAEFEYLAAVVDGVPVVSTPELICVLDRRTRTPIAVDRLRLGDNVQAVALPGPSWWIADERRLAAVGPRAFGVDLDPVLLDRSGRVDPSLREWS